MPDLAALCAPISETRPGGEDMALSLEFDAIQEARRADDPSLPQGDWVTDLKTADWPRVAALCCELLVGHTKDLRLCVWLTEAWGHENSFVGMADGVQLLTQLCQTDWENLHPLPADEEDDIRIASLEKMLSTCEQLMRQQTLTQGAPHEWCLGEIEAAHRLAQRNGRSGEDDESVVDELGEYESARRGTAPEFHAALLRDLDELGAALQRLEAVLAERLGEQAPRFAPVQEVIGDIRRQAGRPNGARTPASTTQNAAIRPRPVESATAPGQGAGLPTHIDSRATAIGQLRMVADYFRRAEPHSPVGYLADKAADWAQMPLHDWLRQVMHDDGELAHLEELLGTRPRHRDGASDA